MNLGFVDIHCHLLPGIDDGARDLGESLAMARMAVEDGTRAIVVTPHQLGVFDNVTACDILDRTELMRRELERAGIPLQIAPGAELRVEEGLVSKIASGEVLNLAGHGRHVLIELPHEVYFEIEPLIEQLQARGAVPILAHPERNQGILRQPALAESLVDAGCLMQVTAGSLAGSFGPRCEKLAEKLVREGLTHFVSSDAHRPYKRRPLLAKAYRRCGELAGEEAARAMFCENPGRVFQGDTVQSGRVSVRRQGVIRWLSPVRAG